MLKRKRDALGRFIRAETRSAPTSWDLLQGGGCETDAGLPVTPHLAENLSAVFAAVQTISETVATLPLVVYRREGEDVRQAAPAHPVSRLFSLEPNELQTAPEFIEMMTAHCLLRGNAYAEIKRDFSGAPVELVPLHPDMVSVVRFPGTRRIAFDVTDWEGGRTRRLLQDEMLHLKDRSDDGIVGKSRLQRARETFGTALATEKFAGRTYRNQAQLSGVLQADGAISDLTAQRLKEYMRTCLSGSGNAGQIAVLEEGLKWQSISVSPKDAEMLSSRQFGVVQIARLFRLTPPLLGDLSGGNFSSLVELNRWFAQHTISPWLTKWERTIERALFSEEGRLTHEVEFDMDVLLRGDMLQRWQAYRIMREIGGASANEVRRWEHINPRTDPAGDEFLQPLNMSPEQMGAPKPL